MNLLYFLVMTRREGHSIEDASCSWILSKPILMYHKDSKQLPSSIKCRMISNNSPQISSDTTPQIFRCLLSLYWSLRTPINNQSSSIFKPTSRLVLEVEGLFIICKPFLRPILSLHPLSAFFQLQLEILYWWHLKIPIDGSGPGRRTNSGLLVRFLIASFPSIPLWPGTQTIFSS